MPDAVRYRIVQGVQYYKCMRCGCLFADPEFIRRIESGEIVSYESAYWDTEVQAARERSFGASLARVAETFRLCTIPINRFVDIGSGTGLLLDAIGVMLPEISHRFFGIEAFPPSESRRSKHPNYRIGKLADMSESFEAGVCIEVIEHLSPEMVRNLAASLAERSVPGSLFFFNSGQPSFVEKDDPDYLDPLGRGHIASYSIAGATQLFGDSGFSIIPFPECDWAFLAEYGGEAVVGRDELLHRMWNPCAPNIDLLKSARFGPLMITMGLESTRCFIE
jgi:hypothetical protein